MLIVGIVNYSKKKGKSPRVVTGFGKKLEA